MRKSIIIVSLLLGACAYQPNIPSAQQAKPTYQADLSACTAQMEGARDRLYNAFGVAGLIYGHAAYSDAEIAESTPLGSFQGQHAYIDKCMKAKGYAVQQ